MPGVGLNHVEPIQTDKIGADSISTQVSDFDEFEAGSKLGRPNNAKGKWQMHVNLRAPVPIPLQM
jgi:hypothetical protein